MVIENRTRTIKASFRLLRAAANLDLERVAHCKTSYSNATPSGSFS
jgi:hypothetical protein